MRAKRAAPSLPRDRSVLLNGGGRLSRNLHPGIHRLDVAARWLNLLAMSRKTAVRSCSANGRRATTMSTYGWPGSPRTLGGLASIEPIAAQAVWLVMLPLRLLARDMAPRPRRPRRRQSIASRLVSYLSFPALATLCCSGFLGLTAEGKLSLPLNACRLMQALQLVPWIPPVAASYRGGAGHTGAIGPISSFSIDSTSFRRGEEIWTIIPSLPGPHSCFPLQLLISHWIKPWGLSTHDLQMTDEAMADRLRQACASPSNISFLERCQYKSSPLLLSFVNLALRLSVSSSHH